MLEAMPNFYRQAGLPDASSTHDGEQERAFQPLGHLLDVRLAPDQPWSRRQATYRTGDGRGAAGDGGQGADGWLLKLYRRHKGVADADLGGDVAGTLDTVAEQPPQRGHVKAQAALLDHHVGPDFLEQLSFGKHAPGTPRQSEQQVECAAAHVHGNTVAGQQTLVWYQAEGAEDDLLGVGRRCVVQCRFSRADACDGDGPTGGASRTVIIKCSPPEGTR